MAENLGMKSQIDQLRSEAEANYSASRWEDSAKTYEHLVGLAQDNNDLALAIDFAIAAIRSWGNLPDKYPRINKLYQVIGIIGLKKAALGFETLAEKAEEENDQKQAAGQYEEAADGFRYIMNFDKAKDCYKTSVDVFGKLGNEALKNKDYETSIYLLTRTRNIYDKILLLLETIIVQSKDLDNKNQKNVLDEKESFLKLAKQVNQDIAKSHEYLAIFYTQKNDPDYDSIAEKEFMKAMTILESIGETQEVKKLMERKKKFLKQ